jgi:hypothetical protein
MTIQPMRTSRRGLCLEDTALRTMATATHTGDNNVDTMARRDSIDTQTCAALGQTAAGAAMSATQLAPATKDGAQSGRTRA